MLDFAAGGLAPASALLVETHLRLSADGRGEARWAETLGGALLERIEPASIAATPLLAEEAADRATMTDPSIAASRSLISAAIGAPAGLNWRWRAPALREVRLPVAGASLMRLAGGRAVPLHDHEGDELTLVLRGAYGDESGVYRAGEIAFASAGVEHGPYVPEGEECVCLIASEGALRFRGLIARAVHAVLS
jgi:putative transcriptional regulator